MQKNRPHIIIFNPDQYRSDSVGCHGNPAALTPNLDACASTDGVSFPNSFCQNTVCTPSRCSFMTGWYPHVRGHRTMYHMLHADRDEPNLLSILKEEGYFVWWGGKNDLLPNRAAIKQVADIYFQPTEADFERWGCKPAEGNHGNASGWRGEPGGDNYFSMYKGFIDKGDDPYYCDGDWQMVLGAIDFIRNYEGDQPLCIYLPLLYPHPPYCAEEPYFSRIDRTALPPRIPATDGLSGKPVILQGILKSQGLQGWDEARWDELRACYLAMCNRIDDQFGMLMQTLKEKELYDDSAVFFFSDHGDYTGDYGLVEKTQNTFEDCLTKVPFVIKPPKGVPVTPRVCPALTELVDFTATVFDLLGIQPGYDSFGRSLVPLLASGETHRDAVFCEGGRRPGEEQAKEKEFSRGLTHEQWSNTLYYPRAQYQRRDDGPFHYKAAMCRTQTHKYVRRAGERDELYDLQLDPQENRNLIDDPACAGLLAQLQLRMLDWYMETADVVPHAPDCRDY